MNGINASDGVNLSSLLQSQQQVQRSTARIASGLRINTAADDAAGAAISERLGSQINGFAQARRNVADGISLAQTAGGALSGISDSVQRIRELALQSANGTLSESDRSALNQEAQQLREEIANTVERTEFNGRPLLRDSANVSLQAGANRDESIEVGLQDFAAVLQDSGLENLDLSTADEANAALEITDTLQAGIDEGQAQLGALSNRLESTFNNLFQGEESASASRSRIRDADYARETAQLAAGQVREQINLALRSQANQDRGQVLQLLR